MRFIINPEGKTVTFSPAERGGYKGRGEAVFGCRKIFSE